MLRFLHEHPNAIIKSNGSPAITMTDESGQSITTGMMTIVVTHRDVSSASMEQFQLVPSFCQKKIEKAFELRVVAIDGTLFAFKILSQDYKLTSTDWRYGNHFLPFEPYDVEDYLHGLICDFMERVGLFSGSIDLMVDHDDTTWFLEVNPTGAWAWLDPLVGGRISDTFAASFAKRLYSVKQGRGTGSDPLSVA